MSKENKTEQSSRPEIAELQTRLEEAEETRRALHNGEVDAVVVGEQTCLLENAEAASNRLLGDALAMVQDAVIVVDNEDHVTYLNQAAEQQYGVTAATILGRALSEMYQPRWLCPEEEAAFAALYDKGYWRGENIHVKRTGESLYVESSVSVLRDYTGRITGKLAIIRDCTERQRAEAALRQSEERFALATQAVGAMIYDWQIVPERIERSRELVNLLGFAPDEPGVATNAWYRTRVHPEDDARARQVIADAIASHAPHFEDEHRVQHKDGHYVWVRDSGVILYDEQGTAVRCVGSIRNIDQRKQIDAALRESEERFAKAFNTSPFTVTISSLKTGKLIEVNDTFVNVTGFSRAEAIGRTTIELGLWIDPPDREEEMETVRHRGQVRNAEYRFRLRDGTEIVGLLSAERLEIGGESFALTTIQNITERKQAEDALRESEGRFRNMADHAPVMIWITETDGTCTYLSQSWYEFTGQTPETGLGFGWLDATHPDDKNDAEKAFLAANQNQEAFRIEYRLRRQEGEYRWAINSAQPRFDPKGKFLGFIGSVIDITERKQTEESLRHQTTLLEALTESVLDGILIVSSDGQMLYSNQRFHDIWNFPPEVIEAQSDDLALKWAAEQTINPAAFLARVKAIYQQGNDEVREEIVMKDGRVFDRFGAPIQRGKTQYSWVWTFRNITARKQSEEALHASEERLRLATAAAEMFSWEMDLTRKIYKWSENVVPVLGFSLPEDFAARAALIHEEDRARSLDTFERAVDENDQFEMEYRLVNPATSEEVWVCSTGVVITDTGGLPARVIGVTQNITKRKRAEEALRKSEAEFRQLANAVPQIVFVADANGKVQYVNEQWMKFSGLSLEETDTPEIVAEVIHPDDRKMVFAKWAQAFESGTPYELEARIRNHKTGEYCWFLMRSEPTKDASGKAVQWFGTLTDITVAKETQEALRTSEQKQRLAIEAAAMTTWELNLKTGTRTLGANYAEVFGSAPQTPQEFLAALHPDDRELVKASVQAAARGEQPYRLQYRTIDDQGAIQWVESFGHLTHDEAGAPAMLLGVVMNITERKVAEEKIETANYRFRVAEEAAQGFNYEWNLVTGVVTRSESLERVLDYQREALAQTWQAWADLIHPDDLTMKTEAEAIEFFHQLTEETLSLEYRVRHRDGHYLWVMERALMIRDKQGRVRRVIGQTMDVTARKEAEVERERLLAQEQQARATAEAATRAKDEFLAVVSHELRNPLNAILGYTGMARTQAYDAAAVGRYCEIVERNAKMQQQLIEDLLDTARIISGKLKIEVGPIDLRLVLEEALSVLLPAATAKQIDLISRLGDEPQVVIGDEARLQQVAWNLLQNAIKFTPNGGRVELRLERDQEQVYIIVSDSGQGIEPEFLNAVFDRFSQRDMARTRRHGGLGLGLALVKDLVALHGGTVTVKSAGTGQGTTFTITLPPRAAQVVAAPPPLRVIAEVQTGPEAIPLEDLPRLDYVRVLVVDDQAEAREIVATALSEWGAVVTPAASGAEARARLAEQPYDVLVCDISMPDEDGYEVIGRIRALEHERGVPFAQRLPAVALTALARPEDRRQALSAGFQMHIAKPVELAELVVVINSLTQNGSRAQD